MNKISLEEVANLATLSSLELTKELAQRLQDDLSASLEGYRQLAELDLVSYQPTYRNNDLENVWRLDEAEPSIDSEKLISLAADSSDSAIIVPKVF